MLARVVDVAGVPIALEATDDVRAEILATLVAGFDESSDPAVATLTVDAMVTAPPDRPVRSEMFGIRFWEAGDGCVVAAQKMVITVERSVARAHLPDLAEGPLLAGCGYLALAWLLARHRRFIVHGAAVERDGRALLLLGNSGAGKSTLAVGALEAGWNALSDDLTILAPHDDDVLVHGVHKAPAVPVEIGGRLVENATLLGDPRARAGLPLDVLTSGGFPLAGVVRITHSDAREGTLRAIPGHEVLPLLLQSFTGSIDSELRAGFFPDAVRVIRRPTWQLGHASDPAVRRAQIARHLDAIASDVPDAN